MTAEWFIELIRRDGDPVSLDDVTGAWPTSDG